MTQQPKERPILFSAPMVGAILEGRKTMTRRVIKGKYLRVVDALLTQSFPLEHWRQGRTKSQFLTDYMKRCPYGQVGDRLWVRETWRVHPNDGALWPDVPVDYAASNTPEGCGWDGVRWRPSIHCPRWASRIGLEITEIRVERLQAITPDDARAEGVSYDCAACQDDKCMYNCTLGPKHPFAILWDSINAKKPGCSWADNPWVWAISFRRIKP